MFAICLFFNQGTVPCRINRLFDDFLYKTTIFKMTENHLIVVKKSQFLSWIVCAYVGSFSMNFGFTIFNSCWVISLQSWKYEKKALFSKEKWKLKVWLLVILELLKILEPKPIEKIFPFIQATEEKMVVF